MLPSCSQLGSRLPQTVHQEGVAAVVQTEGYCGCVPAQAGEHEGGLATGGTFIVIGGEVTLEEFPLPSLIHLL